VADIELVGHAHAAVKLQGLIDDEFSGIPIFDFAPDASLDTPGSLPPPRGSISRAAPRPARKPE
jgi:hypothetical protein